MFTCKFKFSDLEVLRNFVVNNNLDFKKVVILSATELDMPVIIQDVTDTTEKPVPVVVTTKPRRPEPIIVHKEEPQEELPPPKEEPPPLKEEEVAHKPKRKKPVVAQVEPAVTIEVEDDPEPQEVIPDEQEVIPEDPSDEEVPAPPYGLAEDFLEVDEPEPDDAATDEEEEEEDDEPQAPIVHSAQPPSNAEFRNTDLADSLKNVTIDTHEEEDETEEEDDEPPKKLYDKMCHKCGNPFKSETSSAKFCPACMPQRTAKPKPEKPPKKPKPSTQPVVVKPTGPRRCIRCGSMLPEDSQSKICYKCAKTLADSGRELSDVMRTEIELALSCKPSKISRVCLKCREPFFTEEGSPASYCPSCMKKLAAQQSEIPKKTGFF
jgi:hypothetical protein